MVNAGKKSESLDFNDCSSLRSALVSTTLTNLHVLHQYKQLLNLVKDNFMTRPRVKREVTPKKQPPSDGAKTTESQALSTTESG